jgi:hypothetical protein
MTHGANVIGGNILEVDRAHEVRSHFREGRPLDELIQAPCAWCNGGQFVRLSLLVALERDGCEPSLLICARCLDEMPDGD